jgi:hypothetical protein
VKFVFYNERWEVWVKIELGHVNHMASPRQNAFFVLLEGTRAKIILSQSKDFESQSIFVPQVATEALSLYKLFM